MLSIFDIRLQKLFFLTVVFKVATAFLGWYFQMPWSLGFAVPLGIMALYIVLGLKRRDDDISDEKFADTCYYLGFIFTITSIIFSLFDLPNIGTRIQDIAVRFGAAMVSTVAGLAVRVYLVSFKKDAADAVQDAEDAVIKASQRFREQLVMAYEKFRDFEDEVDKSAKGTVERVNMQIEKLSHDHSARLATFFEELSKQNQVAFTSALEEVKGASLKLSASVERYSAGIQGNLESIEQKVTSFADAVTERLRTTRFPDDYFSERLAQPLELLQEASREVASQVRLASGEVSESTAVLAGALKKLKTKATSAEESLETVVRLTATQHAVLDAAQTQLSTLQEIRGALSRFDNLLSVLVDGLATNTATSGGLSQKIDASLAEGRSTREELSASLSELSRSLTSNTSSLADRLEKNVAANEHISNQVGLAAVQTSKVVEKLNAIALAEGEAAKGRLDVSARADAAVGQMASAVAHLQEVASQLFDLDRSVKAQGVELSRAIQSGPHSSPERAEPPTPDLARIGAIPFLAKGGPDTDSLPSGLPLESRVEIGREQPPAAFVVAPSAPVDGINAHTTVSADATGHSPSNPGVPRLNA